MRTLVIALLTVMSIATAALAGEIVEREFEFPRDGGAHKGYGIEWWYTSGHLETEDGQTFGFMTSFFKVEKTLVPVHFLMMGLTDEKNEKHYSAAAGDETISGITLNVLRGMLEEDPEHPFAQKLIDEFNNNREKLVIPDPIEVKTGRMYVQYGENVVEQVSKDRLDFRERLKWDNLELDLTLVNEKAPMPVGGRGVIEMGAGGLSYYYSLTRLKVSGTMMIDGEMKPVTGLAWLDHQWGDWDQQTGFKGWDWFSVQLENNMDFNLFSFRDDAGEQVNATVTILEGDKLTVSRQMLISPHDYWTNPDTGNTYPVGWTVSLPEHDIVLEILPRVVCQEMGLIKEIGAIWEGSTDVRAVIRSETVTGVGYTELTGYAPSIMDYAPAKYKQENLKQ